MYTTQVKFLGLYVRTGLHGCSRSSCSYTLQICIAPLQLPVTCTTEALLGQNILWVEVTCYQLVHSGGTIFAFKKLEDLRVFA